MERPDFSPFAEEYARFRPSYPPGLFDYLASVVERHSLAWDCATGNGQAAVALAEHFRRVVATDVSAEQIQRARQHQRVEYRVAPAEASGLATDSVDLVTVAAALHWFDLEPFYDEVRRIVQPCGVLAAWTYHAAIIDGPVGDVIGPLYWDLLRGYFAPGARLVDDRYEDVSLPGEPLTAPDFRMSAAWTLEQFHGYVNSWSGTQRYMQEHGEDPFERIAGDAARLWENPRDARPIQWPLILRVSRL
jgi:SAM-dependent methyltransferase